MTSDVYAFMPPRFVEEGEGRTKQEGCRESSGMRVLSPRIEPPEYVEEGSMERTEREEGYQGGVVDFLASRDSSARRVGLPSMSEPRMWRPKVSMKEDFPAPGGPAMPTRKEEFEVDVDVDVDVVRTFCAICWRSRVAWVRRRSSVDSTRVTAYYWLVSEG